MSSINPELIPLGLYVHVPWCVKKCPYCDFNSHEPASPPDFAAYVDQLIADARAQAPLFLGRTVSTIFIGGGTPSLMPAALYGKLLLKLKNVFAIDDHAEVTLEANPGTLEHDPFEDYLAAGINRLSIGVQSFDDAKLKKLGRIHGADEARRAVSAAKAAGFTRINIDLMHGLPDQSLDQALSDLQSALDLGVNHISWYQLTLEPNTVFAKRPPTLPVVDELHQIQLAGEELLRAHGFDNYEVSAWTRQDQPDPCKHNLNYWRFGDYAAIGAGAHGKVTLAAAQLSEQSAQGLPIEWVKGSQIYRFTRTRLPKDYLAVDFTKSDHSAVLSRSYTCALDLDELNLPDGLNPIPLDELVFEFMLNALRLKDGSSKQNFEATTGLPVSVLKSKFERLAARGLVQPLDQQIVCTELGLQFLNQVLAEFLE